MLASSLVSCLFTAPPRYGFTTLAWLTYHTGSSVIVPQKERLYHGTGLRHVLAILDHGLSGTPLTDVWHGTDWAIERLESKHEEMRRAHPGDLHGMSEEGRDEYGDWLWRDFGEEAGSPYPGMVYLGRSSDHALCRPRKGEASYTLMVEPTAPLIPDEDWLGSFVLAAAREGPYGGKGSHTWSMDQSTWAAEDPWDYAPVAPMIMEVVSMMGEAFVDKCKRVLAITGADDWRGGAPVAKDVIRELSRTERGRKLLLNLAAFSPTVAHPGAPKVVGALKNEEPISLEALRIDAEARYGP